MSIGNRIKSLRKSKRMTQITLASLVGIEQPTLSELENNPRASTTKIKEFATALDVDENYLLFGDGNVEIINSEVNEWDSNTDIPHDMIAVPFFKDMSLSAGVGALNSGINYNGYKIWFAKSFLKRKRTCPEAVFCITVKGDSMVPRYEEGGMATIDTLPQEIIDGKAYAISYNDQDFIKYLRRTGDSKIIISSENPLYPPFTVSIEELRIIGRVIAYSRED